MLNGMASTTGRIQPLPQAQDHPRQGHPVSRARWRGIPARRRKEGDYRGHGAGARGEVRASSVVLLPCVPSSVAVARGRIGAELREAGLSATAMADAALVTSELLSNAILHARPLPDACVRISWILSSTAVEIIVSDGGGATRPRAARPSLSSIGGRGLGIVEHLCSSWGVRADERGATVWAVVPAPRDGGAAPGGGGPGGRAAAADLPAGGPAAAEGATGRTDHPGGARDGGLTRVNGTKPAARQPAAQVAVTAQ